MVMTPRLVSIVFARAQTRTEDRLIDTKQSDRFCAKSPNSPKPWQAWAF